MPLELVLLIMSELAEGEELPANDMLPEGVVVTNDRIRKLIDQRLKLGTILNLREVEGDRMAVLITALGLPVLGALTFAVPIMGSVVFVNLSRNDNSEVNHANILHKLPEK